MEWNVYFPFMECTFCVDHSVRMKQTFCILAARRRISNLLAKFHTFFVPRQLGKSHSHMFELSKGTNQESQGTRRYKDPQAPARGTMSTNNKITKATNLAKVTNQEDHETRRNRKLGSPAKRNLFTSQRNQSYEVREPEPPTSYSRQADLGFAKSTEAWHRERVEKKPPRRSWN